MPDIGLILLNLICGFLIGYYLFVLRKNDEEKQKKGALPPQPPAPQEAPSESAGALEKRLMLEETIAIITKLSEISSASSTVKGLSGEIVKAVCKILNAEICVLLLLDDDKKELFAAAGTGVDNNTIQAMRIKIGEEISGVAAKFNETKIIADWEKEKRYYDLRFDDCYRQSLVSLPISSKNKAIGVLNVSAKKSGKPFSETDVEILRIISLETAISLQNLKLLNEQQSNYLETIIALANAIDARDPYTYYHSNNVTRYALRLAKEIKLPEQKIEDIRCAGLLHDIGKIGIKDSILMKTDKLTDEEYGQIKNHPAKGEEIIKSLPFLKTITRLIRHHHERFDGKGYPDGIKGEDIEIGARLLAIADSFDAMTTKRVYRPPLLLEEAKQQLIKNKNTQFDPVLVDYFISILEKEPGIVNQDQP